MYGIDRPIQSVAISVVWVPEFRILISGIQLSYYFYSAAGGLEVKSQRFALHWHLRDLEKNEVVILLVHDGAEFTANIVVARTTFSSRLLLGRQEVEVSGKRLESLERRLGVGLGRLNRWSQRLPTICVPAYP